MTLIELIIVIVLVGVMVALAVPSFREFIQNNRIRGATNDFVLSLSKARTEAIKRGRPVVMCRRDPGADLDDCAGTASDDWTTGWSMYAIPISHTAPVLAFSPTLGSVIGAGPTLANRVELRSNDQADGGYFAFDGDGSLLTDPDGDGLLSNESGTLISFGICDERGRDLGTKGAAEIAVEAFGRAYRQDCTQLGNDASCTCDP